MSTNFSSSQTAFEALAKGLLDYAGLFPPARCSMPEAVSNFRAHRASENGWLLSRFCCPAGRLEELREAVGGDWGGDSAGNPDPWRISVIGSSGHDRDSFLENLQNDLEQMKAFEAAAAGEAFPDALEAKLPLLVAYLNDSNRPDLHERELTEFLERIAASVADYSLKRPLEVFIEFPFSGDEWRESLLLLAASAATANRHLAEDESDEPGVKRFALKIRCGGATAKAFPEPKQVAAMISSCQDTGAAFKATAGLHHPTRHYADDLQTKRHGFFNIFLGAALARALSLEDTDLLEIIFDERQESFRFEGDKAFWREREVSAEQIAQARELLAISIGSCSFNEPVEDLEALGLLPLSAAKA